MQSPSVRIGSAGAEAHLTEVNRSPLINTQDFMVGSVIVRTGRHFSLPNSGSAFTAEFDV
jgi:hypothetical protein